MARYIDADALAEKLRLQYCKGCDNYNGIRCGSCDIDFVFDMVEDAPTADVAEVRHGKWVHTDYAMHWLGKDECSECTYHTSDRDDLSHLKYCPNCGARMDGDAE